ncbi:hypothetical protein LOD99_1269 [Oopsacas minuta]|uniref:Uncharacterized protein n=1 Tax=Oopsacas minuta TaxID=111878 RepID=A0AAV7K5R4_9METZ|nr:hypothetical protein LOD99_1269 [Oopsacas minuta]
MSRSSILSVTVNRIRDICTTWPVVAFREGRDLGYHLRTNFIKQLDSRFSDAATLSLARRELEALKRLRTDHYRKRYLRKRQSSYTEMPENSLYLPLSTVVQELYNERQKPFWKRNEIAVAEKYGTPELSEFLYEMGLREKKQTILGRIRNTFRLKAKN